MATPAIKKQQINLIAAYVGTHNLFTIKRWSFKRVNSKLKAGEYDRAYLKLLYIKECLDNLSA